MFVFSVSVPNEFIAAKISAILDELFPGNDFHIDGYYFDEDGDNDA